MRGIAEREWGGSPQGNNVDFVSSVAAFAGRVDLSAPIPGNELKLHVLITESE